MPFIKMPFTNSTAFRAGLWVVICMLAGYVLALFSETFGPDPTIHGFSGLAIMLAFYFVPIGLSYRRVMTAALRLLVGRVGPNIAAFVANTVILTVGLSVAFELGSIFFPTVVIVSSLPGLILWALGLMISLSGMLCAINYTPKPDGQ